ncbi:Cation/hydrogen exchanger family protein [Euphorbia peplus]|nr:Cation/hydrogen exchanger family protein [Euphorbia peplus]
MNNIPANCWNVTSPGVLVEQKAPVTQFLSYSVPLFELQLAIILAVAHGLSFILGRFGTSTFISQILAGIILGPTILGRFNFLKEIVFPKNDNFIFPDTLTEAALFGFLMHFFLNAVDINLASVKRLTGKFAIITGLASVIVPIGIAIGLFVPFYGHFYQMDSVKEAITMLFVQCFTAFSVVVQALKELKIPNAEIGLLLLSLAMISGGISVQMNAIASFFKVQKTYTYAGPYIGFVVVLVFIVRPGMKWIVRRTPVGSPVDSSITCGIMLMGLLCEVYLQKFGQTPGIGAYMFGLIVPAGPPLGSSFVQKFGPFNYAVFLPLAIVVSSMRVDLTLIYTHYGEIKIYVFYIIVIAIVKMLSFFLPMVCWGIPLSDSMLFATIMNSKGTIEMAVYLYVFHTKYLSAPAYALMIVTTLVTSIVVSIIVKNLYDPSKIYAGYADRSVTSLKPKSQLRMLVCVLDQDNIYSITGFLDCFHPTKDRFLVLHVLHLIPLTGFNTPMIIPHNKKSPVFDDSPSDNLIIYFNQYEQQNLEGTSISTYTAISPFSSMNEDISILAFDQVASVIILPFHRKWSIHGRVVSEDVNIRAINQKVLDRAPCSVAVFLDRGKLGRRTKVSLPLGSPISICMIFLGGKDDWEALGLAKRTAEDTSSQLTIMHFMLNNAAEKDVEAAQDNRRDEDEHEDEDKEENEDQDHLDVKALEIWMKTYQKNQPSVHNVEYMMKFVSNGSETLAEISSIADKFDLFIVGRRYGIESPKTSCLSDWVEIPELGTVGDILACKDVDTKAAVLVVQQQRKL